jgi:hypothetical protein
MSEDVFLQNITTLKSDLSARPSGLQDDDPLSNFCLSGIDAIRKATQITDHKVLTELIDCGVRAESLNLLTVVPLVHVAWANGRIEAEERAAILEAAAQVGVRADSPGFVLLNGWLCCRPHRTLIRTWKDYVGAIRKFLSPEAYQVLHFTTISRARTVAEAAGGLMGFLKVSRAEEAAIQELNLAFIV